MSQIWLDSCLTSCTQPIHLLPPCVPNAIHKITTENKCKSRLSTFQTDNSRQSCVATRTCLCTTFSYCIVTWAFIPAAIQHCDVASTKRNHEMLSPKTIRYNWTERDSCDGSSHGRQEVYCVSTTPGIFSQSACAYDAVSDAPSLIPKSSNLYPSFTKSGIQLPL